MNLGGSSMLEHLAHMFGALGPMPSKCQTIKQKQIKPLEEKHNLEHKKKKNPPENCLGQTTKLFL